MVTVTQEDSDLDDGRPLKPYWLGLGLLDEGSGIFVTVGVVITKNPFIALKSGGTQSGSVVVPKQ